MFIEIGLWLLESFLLWLMIFAAPFLHIHMLWVALPLWINWFFTDFYQERDGTSLGNAITNGAIMLWVGIDFIRFLVHSESFIFFSSEGIIKSSLCFVIIFYGVFVVYKGIKQKKYVPKIARVRETTYLLLMFAPVVYGVFDMSFQYLFVTICFFPLWYYFIEFFTLRDILRVSDS